MGSGTNSLKLSWKTLSWKKFKLEIVELKTVKIKKDSECGPGCRDERKERKRVEREAEQERKRAEREVERVKFAAEEEVKLKQRQRASLLCALLCAALYPQIATLHRPPLKHGQRKAGRPQRLPRLPRLPRCHTNARPGLAVYLQ